MQCGIYNLWKFWILTLELSRMWGGPIHFALTTLHNKNRGQHLKKLIKVDFHTVCAVLRFYLEWGAGRKYLTFGVKKIFYCFFSYNIPLWISKTNTIEGKATKIIAYCRHFQVLFRALYCKMIGIHHYVNIHTIRTLLYSNVKSHTNCPNSFQSWNYYATFIIMSVKRRWLFTALLSNLSKEIEAIFHIQ